MTNSSETTYPHAVSTETEINGSAAEVWEVLADFSAVDTWVPFVESSHIEGTVERGVGIERRCDIGKAGNISETVIDWQEGESLSYRVSGFGPMKGLLNKWTVVETSPSTSLVTVELRYKVKFGLLGRLLNFLVLARVLKKRVGSGAVMLLKKRVETGEVVRPRRAPVGHPQTSPANAR
ncbi:Polyketide cyclase / dehydrase and lipid transport [Pseudovibrio axinellae]|uniref:Polyketide cyclase / dehydrase and lipid transport n=1 Tax=Pseudovibrio axinellae TaxID=989403 RepID=A0A165W261_9HYPH|nr:SRPBCC family protein [Pseudovibrio axinellae]KZL15853.1 Polyketide cyclase / dehydrase and lipid transport [Pseudovibrio axinellae]SER87047.1 Ribosome association toxin PasT (RatA) of the RatAB toxin-antitoxin module [Pseudovibrio axinellae]